MPHHTELRAQARVKVQELLDAVGLEKINGKKRDYLVTLWRRVIYLEQKIASAAREGKIFRYDEAEAAALKWLVSQTINQEAEIKRVREELRERRKEEQR